ncbi:DUF7455 domain-containing protein [Jiangella mangrovi]|uniref:DUF7455 domain-containing protein n=1 Tax=Jiangella mangrovi TaxID=1524084 RepID=A0A7W9GRM9_9ACTN|nr:hypothetical protein [Jiangella mangrovi]MBB5788790.1 hypothetical protein [Jiangella mangrovi]
MTTTFTTTQERTPVLVDLQLCDRCGVRARVRVVLAGAGELYLCGHHAGEFRDTLERAGATLEGVAL